MEELPRDRAEEEIPSYNKVWSQIFEMEMVLSWSLSFFFNSIEFAHENSNTCIRDGIYAFPGEY